MGDLERNQPPEGWTTGSTASSPGDSHQIGTAEQLAGAAERLGLLTSPRFFRAYADGTSYRLLTNCCPPNRRSAGKKVAFAVNIEREAVRGVPHIRRFACYSGEFSVVRDWFRVNNKGIKDYDLILKQGSALADGGKGVVPYIDEAQDLISAPGLYVKRNWLQRPAFDADSAQEFVDVLSHFELAHEVPASDCAIAPWVPRSWS